MRIFTVAEIAEQLKVSEKTIRKNINNGELKAMKIGDMWRITEDEKNEFFERRTIKVRRQTA